MYDSDDFPLKLRRHPWAKSMKLRYDAKTDSAVITMPPRSSERSAKKFVQQNLPWLLAQRQETPPQKFLHPGYIIPYQGQDHIIVHNPDNAGRVHIKDRKIIVGGHSEGIAVRIENYLKKQARLAVEPITIKMAAKLDKKYKRIQIRDTKSRWGSCSSSGNLSFSWRLIMAPPPILEYVIAHEVAHLREMNHSADFWNIVDHLVDHAKLSRKWLRSEGQILMHIQSKEPPIIK